MAAPKPKKTRTKTKRLHLDRRAESLTTAAAADGPPDELLDTPALCAWLGVSKQWVEIGRHRGYGPPYKRLGPHRIRYRRGDVLEWLAERTHRRTSEYV